MRPPELEPEVTENGEPIPLEPASGVLEMHPNGYGFLRSPDTNYTRERTDAFVPATMIDRYRLREGVLIKALVQPGRRRRLRLLRRHHSPPRCARVRSAGPPSDTTIGCFLPQ